MNIADKKAAALAAAAARSKALPRLTSSASTSNQSEVTQYLQNLYQLPKLNTPPNMKSCARLLQIELSKVAESQSIMLMVWEKFQAQKMEIAQLKQELILLQSTQ
ncbi:hypothetical protein [Leclercia sp. AS011]|uniref:hypothetical protein n=1 Tax=Leclercia sp. AS011 TaxID=3081257 RepID=UPI003018D879